MKLKVLTFNIHKGVGLHRRAGLSEIRDFIRSTEADLVFLQEVMGLNIKRPDLFPDQNFESQYEYLADEIWSHYSYAKNAVYDHGHHGNVILSKYPIVKWNQEDCSTNVFEQRGILSCKISIPDEISGQQYFIQAYCIHFNIHFGRFVQYMAMARKLERECTQNSSVIIAGDFNDWNKSASKVMEEVLDLKEAHKLSTGHYAKTFPSFFPMLSLDRTYFKNLKLESCRILQDSNYHISDHLPVLTQFEISSKNKN